MCTLGAFSGQYLFKNRDMSANAGLEEELARGEGGRFRYVGVAGHASPLEKGLNSGINEAGIAAAMTFVDQVSLVQALETRTPRGVLIEKILGEAGNLAEALQITIDFFHRQPLVGGNIAIITPDGGAVVEQLYPRIAVEIVTQSTVVRTNHFLNLTVPGSLAGNLEDSQARFQRFSQLLSAKKATSVGVADIKRALADHAGSHPICRHGPDAITVSTAVYSIADRTLHYAYGNPCEETLKQYAV